MIKPSMPKSKHRESGSVIDIPWTGAAKGKANHDFNSTKK